MIRYDAALVEEAVLIRLGHSPPEVQREFHDRRAALYGHGDAEEREARFEAFHGEWFLRLGLDRPLHEALRGRPRVLRQVAECHVLRARSHRSELADLAEPDRGPAERILLVRLRAASLADSGRLLAWLRHELLHVSDMLDPHYGYLPHLPRAEQGPVLDGLLRERYRVVWDVTVAGRLLREGLEAPSTRDRARSEFQRTFSHLGPQLEAAFCGWFEEPAPTHSAIMDFIREGSVKHITPVARPALEPVGV